MLVSGYPAAVLDEDLVTLFRNDDAAALVLAWPRVGQVPGMSETEIVRAWSRASGVSLFETRRLAPVLTGAKLCLDGGEIDPKALQVARSLVARQLGALVKDTERRPPA